MTKKFVWIAMAGLCAATLLGCGPSSNESRIVKNGDGSYSVQTYQKYPGWQDVGRGNKGTLEEAKRLKRAIDCDDVTVVEVIKE